MYVPAHNQIHDHAAMTAFMRAYSFAAVTSHGDGGLRATHLPVLIEKDEGWPDEGGNAPARLRILGHMAKANPQWKDFGKDREVMLIFSGPHAYVSPRLYERQESVPTWNYAAVHAYGVPQVLETAEEKVHLIERLIGLHDPDYLAQFRNLRPEFVSQRLSAVTAFRIEVGRLEARFKLSQDRLPTERERVIAALSASGEDAAMETAQLMRVHAPVQSKG